MPVVDLSLGERVGTDRGGVVVCVPLYGAHDHFARCLRSLLAHTSDDVALLIADDCTPDPASRALVDTLEREGVLAAHRVFWLNRPHNVGFVENVNGAFEVSAPADVVIVNSDVIVADGWLEGMRDAARSDATVATVTALTNHGTLVSVPARNRPQAALPQDRSLDAAARDVREGALRLRPRLPVAIGHCLWVQRSALDLVGDFDLAFAPGYGEEVDFAQRCLQMGLRHILADDVLVAHHGGGSFDALEGRSKLQLDHEAIIDARYPYYVSAVKAAEIDQTGPLSRSVALGARALRGLRVTIDGRSLGPFLTGTQVHSLELIAALSRTGDVRVRVLLPPDPGGYVQPALAGLGNIEFISAADVGQIESDDVVHRPWQIGSYEDLELLAQLGHRIVLTQQDLIAYHNPSYFPGGRQWLEYRRLTAEAAGLSALTLFFSEHARQDAIAEDLVAPERTRVVYIGTDHQVSVQRPEPKAPPRVPLADRPFLLCLGTDFRHKNRQFALRVLRSLRERHGWEGRLVLAGPSVSHGSSAPEEAAYLAAHPDLASSVIDLPAIGEASKAWLLGHCAAVLYPTTYEGFGLVPFEAADAGRPCIFAAQTSLAEVLDESAALIVPWDPDLTADRVIGILTDPSLAEEQVERVRRSATRFRWDTTGRAARRRLRGGARVAVAVRSAIRRGQRPSPGAALLGPAERHRADGPRAGGSRGGAASPRRAARPRGARRSPGDPGARARTAAPGRQAWTYVADRGDRPGPDHAGAGRSPMTETQKPEDWVARFDRAGSSIATLVGSEGVRLESGVRVLDATAGDGAVALGLTVATGAGVWALDELPVDVEGLASEARRHEHIEALPEHFTFAERNDEQIPTGDAYFDFAYSWGGLERARKPISLLGEIRRVLKPQGLLLVHLDPLWVATGPDPQDPWRADGFALDELQHSLLAARFSVIRVELRSHPVRLPRELARYRLSQLAVAGATVLAVPDE